MQWKERYDRQSRHQDTYTHEWYGSKPYGGYDPQAYSTLHEESVYASPRRFRNKIGGESKTRSWEEAHESYTKNNSQGERRASVCVMTTSSPRNSRKIYQQPPQTWHQNVTVASEAENSRNSYKYQYQTNSSEEQRMRIESSYQNCDDAYNRVRRHSDVSPSDFDGFPNEYRNTFESSQRKDQNISRCREEERDLRRRTSSFVHQSDNLNGVNEHDRVTRCRSYNVSARKQPDYSYNYQRPSSFRDHHPIHDSNHEENSFKRRGSCREKTYRERNNQYGIADENELPRRPYDIHRRNEIILSNGVKLRYDNKDQKYHAVMEENTSFDNWKKNRRKSSQVPILSSCLPSNTSSNNDTIPVSPGRRHIRRKSFYDTTGVYERPLNSCIEVRQNSAMDGNKLLDPAEAENSIIKLVTKSPELEHVDSRSLINEQNSPVEFSTSSHSNKSSSLQFLNKSHADQEVEISSTKTMTPTNVKTILNREDCSIIPELSTVKLIAHQTLDSFINKTCESPKHLIGTKKKPETIQDSLTSTDVVYSVKKIRRIDCSSTTSEESEPDEPNTDEPFQERKELSALEPKKEISPLLLSPLPIQHRQSSPNLQDLNLNFSPLSGNSPSVPDIIVFPEIDNVTNSLKLTKLKDVTSGWMSSSRSRDITFTVPPSPLSPRKPFPPSSPSTSPSSSFRLFPDSRKLPFDGGMLSPLIPRRFVGGDTSPKQPSGGSNLLETSQHFSHSSTSLSNLGSLDPELYKTAGDVLPGDLPCFPHDHLGRLWYRLEYRDDCEKLMVTLIKIRNLPSRRVTSNHSCDPYVKLVLLPDERRSLQTRRKQNTCNPRYDHSFAFMVGAKELAERTVKFTVYDVDRDRKHNVIGHAFHHFNKMKTPVVFDGREVFYKDLDREACNSPRDAGQIEVTLCYNDNLDRLTCILGAVKGVKIAADSRGPGELQVRVSLLHTSKVIKTKKSSVVRPNTAGETGFHESFMFKVSGDQLDTSALTVLVHQAKKSDNVIGRVQLGSFMFARGRALEHWNQMLAKKREHVLQWHPLT